MSYPEGFTVEEPDAFDELKTGGEVCAFIYRQFGEDGLRALLAHDVDKPFDREWVQDIADELHRAGLRKAAGIAAKVAATKPSMTDLIFCCYTDPTNIPA
jgi:hypothetical protein